MTPPDNEPGPAKSGPLLWFETVSRVGDDFRKIGAAAIVPAVIVALILPATVDLLAHPEQLVYQAAIRTFPLTLTVAVIWISLNSRIASNVFYLLLLWSFSIVLAAGIADYYGCDKCGDLHLIDAARERAQAWVPKWISDSAGILNAIPFLVSCIVEFVRLYGVLTFLAALVCGSYLGLSGIYLLRPGGPFDRRHGP